MTSDQVRQINEEIVRRQREDGEEWGWDPRLGLVPVRYGDCPK